MSHLITRRSVALGLPALALAGTLARPAFAATAEEILRETDRLRNPQRSFRSKIKLTDYVSGKKNDELEITVFSKPRPNDGQFRSLVHIDKPRKDAGKIMLRDGKELFFYDPDAANTIRISPQQRLLGQASNGDVMTTNFWRDYSASLKGTETVQDSRKKNRTCHALKMKAKTRAAVYGSIDFWVDSSNNYPVKGRFYSASGKLLKIAFYDGFRDVLGTTRPTKVLIVDGLNSRNVTTMDFGKFKLVDLPNGWFQKSYLPKFSYS